jgi:hypothetical protein
MIARQVTTEGMVMLAHLYFQQQLLRERHEDLMRAAARRRRVPAAVPTVRVSRLQWATRSLGARLLRIPAPTPLQHGC